MQKTSSKLPQFRSFALVAVGSNVSFRKADVGSTVIDAIHAVVEESGVIRTQSRLFRTPAFPAGSGPDFVNAAFSVQTALDPETFLERLHDVEQRFGRRRDQRWGPRTLDLDLIAMDDVILPDAKTHARWVEMDLDEQLSSVPDQLILPHPRLQDRAFVLVPLSEVAPDWRHPVLGLSVKQMCAALSDKARAEVQPLQ
jgi:2-amino-4-hydroxy-6-hydroxymethyldihydropteridine diphosphokinase